MSDIFISYANSDRPRAEQLAKALEEQGWSVWWDRAIPPGKSFDQVIEEAIQAAKCVVVLWSEISIKSDWVKEEAAIGKRRKILVPVKIDPVDPPIGFGLIQAADLTNWEAEKSETDFSVLLNAISEFTGPPVKTDNSPKETQLPDSKLERESEGKLKDRENVNPAASDPKPDENESPRKKRSVFGIGAAALILVVAGIGWLFYSNSSEQPPPKLKPKVFNIPEQEAFNPQRKVFRIPSANVYNPKHQITLEAWFKTAAIGKRQAIITKLHPDYQRGEPYYQYNLELRDTGKLYFALSIKGVREFIDQVSTIEPNRWYHVAATYNGKKLELYVNGQKSGEAIQEGGIDVYNMPLVIGGDRTDRPFMGQLAEVRIWKVARTENQIRDAMRKTIPPTESLIFSSTNFKP